MFDNYVIDPHRMMGPSQNMNQMPQFNNHNFRRYNNRRYDGRGNSLHEKKDYKDYDEPQKQTLGSAKGLSMINYNDI